MDLLEDVGADDGVQVRLHVLEDQVDVAVVVRLEHVGGRDDVLVPVHLLEELDLAERALRVGRILEGVKDLLERDDLFRPIVERAPHDAVRALPELLRDLVLAQDWPVNLLRHRRGVCR